MFAHHSLAPSDKTDRTEFASYLFVAVLHSAAGRIVTRHATMESTAYPPQQDSPAPGVFARETTVRRAQLPVPVRPWLRSRLVAVKQRNRFHDPRIPAAVENEQQVRRDSIDVAFSPWSDPLPAGHRHIFRTAKLTWGDRFPECSGGGLRWSEVYWGPWRHDPVHIALFQ